MWRRIVLIPTCVVLGFLAIAHAQSEDRFSVRFHIAHRIDRHAPWMVLSLRGNTLTLKPESTSEVPSISLSTDGCNAVEVQKLIREFHATERLGLTLSPEDLRVFGGVSVEELEGGKFLLRHYDLKTKRAKFFESLYAEMLALRSEAQASCDKALAK